MKGSEKLNKIRRPDHLIPCIHPNLVRNHALEKYKTHKIFPGWDGFLRQVYLVAQTVRSLPTMRETRVQPLDPEDLLEKEMATHSSIAWKIPWTEQPGRL